MPLPVLDMRLGDGGAETRSYRLPATCCNCGDRYVAIIDYGHEPDPFVECPNCGVGRHWYLGKASELRESEGRNV